MDTLKQLASLTNPAKAQTIVTLGRLRLFFSYELLIAFEAPTANMRHPVFVGLSSTTSKHAGQMGCAQFPAAPTVEAFEAGLRVALRSV